METTEPVAIPEPAGYPIAPQFSGETRLRALGEIIGARSGDKGGAANIGCWIPDPSEPEAVAIAWGEGSPWAAAVDGFHDTAAVWATDAALPVDEAALARADAAYAWLVDLLTPATVRQLLPEAAGVPVEIHLLPELRAVNILLPGLLGRGVADSNLLDPQAKGLGEYLRARFVPVPVELLPQ
jgi:hypothetical protein